MKKIPDEIKKQIDDYAFEYEKENPSSKYTFKDVLSGAEFGYSLASKALSDANKEIERLRAEVKRLNDDNKRDPWDDLGKWANENTF